MVLLVLAPERMLTEVLAVQVVVAAVAEVGASMLPATRDAVIATQARAMRVAVSALLNGRVLPGLGVLLGRGSGTGLPRDVRHTRPGCLS